MKRREFCRKATLAGGAFVLAPLINSCARDVDLAGDGLTATNRPHPTGTPLPTETTAADPTNAPVRPTERATDEATAAPTATETGAALAGTSTIALVKTNDRVKGLQQALELLGQNPVRGNRVFLKPNFNSAEAAPASTHPDILRTLVGEMNEMGARAITIGERSGMGDTRAVLEQTGVFGLAGEFGFDTVIFDELDEQDWVVRDSGDSHWASGFAVPRILLDSECVVQTCNLKTHSYGGHFTMSLKNSVGFVARTVEPGGRNYMSELHGSRYQRQMIAEINTVYKPSLIVMDGVEAFVDGGPAVGTLVSPSVILAGSDPVAMDAVGVAILRMFGTTPEVSQGKIFEQEQIARAVELGLGVESPERIRLVTGDAASEAYANQIRPYLA